MKLTRKIYTTRNEKILDFVIGFVGWYLINGLMYACSIVIVSNLDTQQDFLSIVLLVLPLIVNIIGLILLGMTLLINMAPRDVVNEHRLALGLDPMPGRNSGSSGPDNTTVIDGTYHTDKQS